MRVGCVSGRRKWTQEALLHKFLSFFFFLLPAALVSPLSGDQRRGADVIGAPRRLQRPSHSLDSEEVQRPVCLSVRDKRMLHHIHGFFFVNLELSDMVLSLL